MRGVTLGVCTGQMSPMTLMNPRDVTCNAVSLRSSMLSLSIVCFIVVASSICTASASIPLEMLSGEWVLSGVNATSFLFEKSSAHVDSPMLSGPYLFRVHPYNGLFFAEVDLRKRSWATVTFTKKATAINVSVFTNVSVTTILIEKMVADDRPFFKRYYLLIIIALYAVTLVPHFIIRKNTTPAKTQSVE